MPRLTLKLPGKSAEQSKRLLIARTFSAYLNGHLTYKDYDAGPFERDDSVGQNSWLLDSSNDFWLHFTDDGQIHLDCRYEDQVPVIEAMLALFQVRQLKTFFSQLEAA